MVGGLHLVGMRTCRGAARSDGSAKATRKAGGGDEAHLLATTGEDDDHHETFEAQTEEEAEDVRLLPTPEAPKSMEFLGHCIRHFP